MNLTELTNEKLQFGIARCIARMKGEMPMGLMTPQLNRDALKEYRDELVRRNVREFEFE
jgi:hypothetical protein